MRTLNAVSLARSTILASLVVSGSAVRLTAAPASSWTVQTTVADCSGAGQQGTVACYSYANDRYENLDYSIGGAAGADIVNFMVGNDANYFYFEFDLASAWSSSTSPGHQIVLELDTNSGSEANRGDYYVGIFQKIEFNSTSWIDASSSGGYEMYQDSNNNVGGSNPTTSDFGGSPGDGYESAVSSGADRVWARIVSGNFQVAVRRSTVGSPMNARVRGWSRQSTSLDKSKLYFHDQNSTTDVNQIDNSGGLGTTNWTLVGQVIEADIRTTKTGLTNVAAGANLTYTITVTNLGPSPTTNLVVRDVIPTNSVFVSAASGGTYSAVSGAVTWTPLTNFTANATTNFTVTVTAPASGSMTNRVSSTATTSDPTASNNNGTAPEAIVITTISPSADVRTTKTGLTNVVAGANLTYTITVTNIGPSPTTNLVVRDVIPTNSVFVSASSGGTYSAVSGDVTWTPLTNFTASATTNFTVTVTAPASGSMTNRVSSTATTSDPTASNNNGTAAEAIVITTISPSADVRTTKTGLTNVIAGANLTYTITVTNVGPSPTTNLVIRDVIPTNSTFVSASSGGTYNVGSGDVTWTPLTNFTANATTNFTVTVTAPASGSMTNRVSSTASTSDPDASNNNGTAPGAIVITTVTPAGSSGADVSGYAYLDANQNGFKDGAEAGTALGLFAKLVPTTNASGPALLAVTVNAGSGVYTLTNVASGLYNVVLDNNATLADVTPTIPAGWLGTEMPAHIRTNVAVASVDVPNQNFGLIQAMGLSGRVFKDDGTGGGTANDGVVNGTESGIGNVTVKLTDTSGSTVYATATTDGSGNYTLLIPGSLANGTPLKVVETNPSAHLSTGASLGNTGGAYDRSTDTVSFTLTTGTTYSGVSFGDVPENIFIPDGQQAGLPGTFVVYAHTFTAASVGQVTFSTVSLPNPTLPGWSQVIYRDLNCNAQLDASEAVISGAISVAVGENVCILIKEFIPVGAPLNAQDQVTVTATFNYTGASPALNSIVTRTDLTTVGTPTTAGLTLLKSVDKDTALPGETITYTVTYANNGADVLSNVVIYDETPAFTSFVSAGNGALPNNLTGVVITSPGAGNSGPLRWTFTGTLAPGHSGTVTFSVTVAQ